MRRNNWLIAGVAVLLLCGCAEKPNPKPAIEQTTETSEGVGGTESTEPTEAEGHVHEEAHERDEIFIASDIHYLAPGLSDGGEKFSFMVEHGDGKVVQYIDQITDAFFEEVIELSPTALILSGDLSLNGELLSHEAMGEKLRLVEEQGIPVLVIPGNHDINNPSASEFKGDETVPAAFTTPEDFARIYGDFGYSEAVSRDPDTLSYVYQLDETTRILMLDTCQYDLVNRVGGTIDLPTYDWIEAQLEEANDYGMELIPVSHHNLLDESEVYVEDCTIEHGERLKDMLEDWGIWVYLSGHLHLQHTKQSMEGEGIYELVTSSLATPPCQYGVLTRMDDLSYHYDTRAVNVESWAQRNGTDDKNLLNFNDFKEPFLNKVFYTQAQDAMKYKDITETKKDMMAAMYAKLNTAYYAGKAYLVREEIEGSPAYQLWQEYMYEDILLQYVQSILTDAVADYNHAVAAD